MKNIWIFLIAFGLTSPLFAQNIKTEELSEVTVHATNYKYLNSMNTREVSSVPVELLVQKVASFDLKNSEFYQDDYDLYHITFYIPEGKILAAFDKEGKLLRTAERFRDINLPTTVKKTVLASYPGWKITKDIYLVTYHNEKGANKRYKLKLKKGKKNLRVKIDETGRIL